MTRSFGDAHLVVKLPNNLSTIWGITQKYRHDPEAGSYGDCQRCCLATVLGLDREEVLHFYHDGNDTNFSERLHRYLSYLGLALLSVPQGSGHQVWTGADDPNVLHMMFGPSPRDPSILHSVVAVDGVMVFDPHPDGTGILDIEGYEYIVPTRDALHIRPLKPEYERIAIEVMAQEIYESWSAEEYWVPWQRGGNSIRQDDARHAARALNLL